MVFKSPVGACLLILIVQSALHADAQPAESPVVRPDAQPSATDLLGDSLPPGARLRLGTSRFHAPSTVSDLALSPDGAAVVTVDNHLVVWDAATGKERWRSNAEQYGFDSRGAYYGTRTLAFSSDSSRFYTPGRPNEVLIWDTLSGRHDVLTIKPADPQPLRKPHAFRSIDVTADGQKFALGRAEGLLVCLRDGRQLYEIANAAEGPLQADQNDRLAFSGHYSLGRFSPNGTILAVVNSEKPEEIQLYGAATGQLLRRIELGSRLVRSAFSPDGKQIVVTERDSAVRLYDVATGERVWSHVVQLTNPFENYTSAVEFSPDGRLIAVCATDNRIYLLNASNGEELAQLTGHTWYPWALAFTADGKLLYSSGWDGAIRRWDAAARGQLPLPKGVHATGVVAAAPDGKLLAYEDDSGAIRLVDAPTAAERRTLALPGSEYSQLLFSADSRQLAGGGTSGDQVHVTVWDVATGQTSHRWEWPKGRDPHSKVESLCFTPDGSRLAAAVFRQSAAYVWDLTGGQQIAQVSHKSVYGLSFSPDNQTLATAGWDKTVRFWDSDSGEMQREMRLADDPKTDLRMYTVCYAPDGGLIATAHLDGTVRVWQADNMLLRRSFQVPGQFVYGAMSFSPDSLWLATGATTGSVTLWHPSTGEKVWDVGRHQGHVYTVGFGGDGRTLVSGGDDGVCYSWDLRPANWQPNGDFSRMWNDLVGDDGPAAYRAIWSFSEVPDRAVALLAEKLRPVTTLIDLDRVTEGDSAEETQSRRRLQQLLANKEPKVESTIAVRRAVSLLRRLGTPEAIQLLQELV